MRRNGLSFKKRGRGFAGLFAGGRGWEKNAGRLTAAGFCAFVLTAAFYLFFSGRAMRLWSCLPLLFLFLYFVFGFRGDIGMSGPGTDGRDKRGAPGSGAAFFAILSLLLLFQDARIIHILDVGRACLMGTVLFLVLGLLYWFAASAENRRWIHVAIMGILMAVYCFSAVHALNYALVDGQTRHFPARVVDARKYRSSKGGNTYHVTIQNEAGALETLTVSVGVYRRALEGHEVEICQWVSVFGIRCRMLHGLDETGGR